MSDKDNIGSFIDLSSLKMDTSTLKMPTFKLPVLVSQINRMDDHSNALNELNKVLSKGQREKSKREVENNKSLKSIVQYNEEISNYNKDLVSLNERILSKMSSLDDTLLFLNTAFGNKADRDTEQSQQEIALLLELITIIDAKDQDKLKQFMNTIAAPLGVGAVLECIKIKFGLG